jgi:hypothetical protein
MIENFSPMTETFEKLVRGIYDISLLRNHTEDNSTKLSKIVITETENSRKLTESIDVRLDLVSRL